MVTTSIDREDTKIITEVLTTEHRTVTETTAGGARRFEMVLIPSNGIRGVAHHSSPAAVPWLCPG
jgi:hypothetical protein